MTPLIKTLASFGGARLYKDVILSAVLSIIMVGCFVLLATFISANWIQIEIEWLDTTLNMFVSLLSGLAGWFMLPSLTALIAGMFQQSVIYKIEKVYYPNHKKQDKPRFWPDFKHDVKFTLFALCLNVLALPLYLFGIGFFISILLNGYLLGREFFEGAAGQHMGKHNAKLLRKKHRWKVFLGGIVISLLALVPVVNIFNPIFAIAWMTHLYHKIEGN